jgi:hypothetical protein
MTDLKHCIENCLEITFRYSYSNPDLIRTIIPVQLKETKNGSILLGTEYNGKIKCFKIDGIMFEDKECPPAPKKRRTTTRIPQSSRRLF